MWDGKPLLGIQPSRPNHPAEPEVRDATRPWPPRAPVPARRNGRRLHVYLTCSCLRHGLLLSVRCSLQRLPQDNDNLSEGVPLLRRHIPPSARRRCAVPPMLTKEGCHTACLPSSSKLCTDGFRTKRPWRGSHGRGRQCRSRYSKTHGLEIFRDDASPVYLFLTPSLVMSGKTPWLRAQLGLMILHEDVPDPAVCVTVDARAMTRAYVPYLPSASENGLKRLPAWVRSEPWLRRPHPAHGTWKGLDCTACMLLTAYGTWSASLQYQVQCEVSREVTSASGDAPPALLWGTWWKLTMLHMFYSQRMLLGPPFRNSKCISAGGGASLRQY